MNIDGFIGDRWSPLDTIPCTVRLLKHGSSHRYPTELSLRLESDRENGKELKVLLSCDAKLRNGHPKSERNGM